MYLLKSRYHYHILIILSLIIFFTSTFIIPEEIWGFSNTYREMHLIYIHIPERKYILLLLSFLIFLYFLLFKKINFVYNQINILFIIFYIYIFSMLLFTSDEYLIFGMSNAFGYLFSIFILIILLQCNLLQLENLLKFNFFLLVVFVLITNYMLPINFFQDIIYRYGGLYNPNRYAIFVAYAIILNILMIYSSRNILLKIIYTIIFFYLVLNLLLTVSRSAFLSLFISLIAISMFDKNKFRRYIAIFSWLGLMILLVLIIINLGIDIERKGNLEDRLNGSLLYPLSYAENNFLLPLGYGINILMRSNDQPLDNSYLYFLLVGGLPALLLILFIYFKLLKLIFIKIREFNYYYKIKIISLLIIFKILHSLLEGSHKLLLSWTDLLFLISVVYLIKSKGGIFAKNNISN